VLQNSKTENASTDRPRELGLPVFKRRLVWFDLDFVSKPVWFKRDPLLANAAADGL
jgi:hypothetical protein